MPRKSKPNGLPDLQFPPLGQDIDISQTTSAEQPQQPDLAAQVAQLSKTVETMVAASGRRDEQIQNLLMTLAGRGAHPAPQAEPAPTAPAKPVVLDLSGLPDPTKDPAGYAAELAKRVDATVQARVSEGVQAGVKPLQQKATAAERQQRLNDLWTRFTQKYPDLKDFQDIAEASAARILREAGATDPEYIFGQDNGETFINRVADAMHKRLEAIRGRPLDDSDDEEGDAEARTTRQGQPDPGRTLGIPGAAPTTTTPGTPGRNSGPSDLVSELRAEQMRGRIY